MYVCLYVCMYLVQEASNTQLIDVDNCHVTVVKDNGMTELMPWCAHVRILRLYVCIHVYMYACMHGMAVVGAMYISSDWIYVYMYVYAYVYYMYMYNICRNIIQSKHVCLL